MSKKYTIEEFFKNKNSLAIRVDTEELATKLTLAFHNLGYCFARGESYLYDHKFDGERMYYTNCRRYARGSIPSDFTVIPISDIIIPTIFIDKEVKNS